jgi:hypothetical protein
MQKLKMNMVSVQYFSEDQARPLMDFLARAEAHGIKVHCFIEGLHPLNFGRWGVPDARVSDAARRLITAAHLNEDPAMFAYDAGWEVHVGKYDIRKGFDKDWTKWVTDRYGSLASAEQDWEYAAARNGDTITGPSDEQLTRDGEWRRYVAAYRRFWDDEISKRYKAVRAVLKSVYEHHLLGARSGYGGNGSMGVVADMPFDLASGAIVARRALGVSAVGGVSVVRKAASIRYSVQEDALPDAESHLAWTGGADQAIKDSNPHMKFADTDSYGFALVSLDATKAEVTFVQLGDPLVKNYGGVLSRQRFVTNVGTNQVTPL